MRNRCFLIAGFALIIGIVLQIIAYPSFQDSLNKFSQLNEETDGDDSRTLALYDVWQEDLVELRNFMKQS